VATVDIVAGKTTGIESVKIIKIRIVYQYVGCLHYSSGAYCLEKKGSVAKGQLLISLFSTKPHFLLKLENLPINFTKLTKYHISKISQICSILATFAHRSHYNSFLHRVFRNLSCFFTSD